MKFSDLISLRNARFLRNLYTNKYYVRELLESENSNVKIKDICLNKNTIFSLLESNNINFIRCNLPGHYYSPIPDLQEIMLKSKHNFERSEKNITSINIDINKQLDLLKIFSIYYKDMPFTDIKNKYRYYFDNNFFSYGDGIILYSFLRKYRPKRIVEVGSGFSSALMLDVNDIFLEKKVEFTFVEPFPDRLNMLIEDEDRINVNITVNNIQDVNISLFESLEENDILFIDSSHVAKCNSDVLHIFFKILPQLKNGVIIHFHDILWPFEYPMGWFEEGMAWNEAYFVRAFLQYNPAFEILYFNSYMALHHADLLNEYMPLILKTPSSKLTPGNTSLWIRKTH